MSPAKKRMKERFALRVCVAGKVHSSTGVLMPADEYTKRRLRELGYKVEDLLFAEFSKPRNPEFHRRAHRIGTLLSRSIDDFNGMDAHEVLKKLQLDAEIECEESRAIVPGLGVMRVLTAISLAYESMEQGRFYKFVNRIYSYIAMTYWPDMTPEQIGEMVETYNPVET